eukprot:28244-Eustigmatos_ZCMA.PRE.1
MESCIETVRRLHARKQDVRVSKYVAAVEQGGAVSYMNSAMSRDTETHHSVQLSVFWNVSMNTAWASVSFMLCEQLGRHTTSTSHEERKPPPPVELHA